MGRRSDVIVSGGLVVAGTADGTVTAIEAETLDERWSSSVGDAAVVSSVAFADGIVVGERGPDGEIRLHDRTTGEVHWRYPTTDDIGIPQKETRFFLPFIADIVVGDDRLYAVARRYERNDGHRDFTSVVYAFEADGTIEWTYRTDGSPISLDTCGDRVAVGYNRCTGKHQRGLVVLDANTGDERYSWNPDTDSQRRIGDVSLLDDGVVVTSHGDYRGYRLDANGEECWFVDLGTPQEANEETLYTYPNHVHATDKGVVFVTGNTYPEDGRETESLHPREHAIFGYTAGGERTWTGSVGGFVNGIDDDGTRIAVPCAQHFRRRDPDTHALRLFDIRRGHQLTEKIVGVTTAASIADGTFAAIEEPIVYHDGGERHGRYRLHVWELD